MGLISNTFHNIFNFIKSNYNYITKYIIIFKLRREAFRISLGLYKYYI